MSITAVAAAVPLARGAISHDICKLDVDVVTTTEELDRKETRMTYPSATTPLPRWHTAGNNDMLSSEKLPPSACSWLLRIRTIFQGKTRSSNVVCKDAPPAGIFVAKTGRMSRIPCRQ